MGRQFDWLFLPLAYGLLSVYKAFGTLWLGGCCRFTPSCSDYAVDALRTHGAILGSWLAVRRIVRCRPGGSCGFDPVPEISKIQMENQQCQSL